MTIFKFLNVLQKQKKNISQKFRQYIINMYKKQDKASTLDDFQVIDRIGEGSYSKVFKVIRKLDSHIYAMKKVEMRQLKQKEKENALNEVRLIASFDDQNIVSFKEVFLDETSQTLCIIMEFATGGDLQKKIQIASKQSQYIAEPEIWRALYNITKGLKRLHDNNIIHRDLKCANIFISENCYKLGDLNVSKVAKQGLVQTQTGTPYYASPEVWKDQPYGIKSDIWSLGCVIYEMTALRPPFRASDMQGLFKKVQSGLYDPIPKIFSQDLKQIISLLLKVDPYKRPSCTQILNNSLLLKNISNYQIDSISNKVELLDTILFPKNFLNLKSKLPKSKYNKEDELNKSVEVMNHQQKAQMRAQSAVPVLNKYDQYPSAPHYNSNTPKQPKIDNGKISQSSKQLAPLNPKVNTDPQYQPQSQPSSVPSKGNSKQKQSDVFKKEEKVEKNQRQEQQKLLEQKKAEQQKLFDQQRNQRQLLPQIQEECRRDSDYIKKIDQSKQPQQQPQLQKIYEEKSENDRKHNNQGSDDIVQKKQNQEQNSNRDSEKSIKKQEQQQKIITQVNIVETLDQQLQQFQSLPQKMTEAPKIEQEVTNRFSEVAKKNDQQPKQLDQQQQVVQFNKNSDEKQEKQRISEANDNKQIIDNQAFRKREEQIIEQYTKSIDEQKNLIQQYRSPQINNKSKITDLNEEPQLVLSGLINLNPQSINSILCQPILKANENPFPTQAKVVRQKKKEMKQQSDDQAIKISKQQLEKVLPIRTHMSDAKEIQHPIQHQRQSKSQRPESALEFQNNQQQRDQKKQADDYYYNLKRRDEERGILPQVKGRSGGNAIVNHQSQQQIAPIPNVTNERVINRQQSAKYYMNQPY